MKRMPADIIREYGPFPGADKIHGVTYDGAKVWFASSNGLNTLEPDSGKSERAIDVPADAGTAFDGRHLYQLADKRIQKIDPKSGRVIATIPTPDNAGGAGLTWAEGTLWLGQHRARQIHQIDPDTGKVLRTIASDRFVTGVTWVDGELWHGTLENDHSELREVDPGSGAVRERLALPDGKLVSGLESDGGELLYCGGARSGLVRVVKRTKDGGS